MDEAMKKKVEEIRQRTLRLPSVSYEEMHRQMNEGLGRKETIWIKPPSPEKVEAVRQHALKYALNNPSKRKIEIDETEIVYRPRPTPGHPQERGRSEPLKPAEPNVGSKWPFPKRVGLPFNPV